ncbi:alpha/beta hydrolase family esterase [Streptomyces sp. NPDC097107]|uniref:extracellular catalytic domain type 1 short-chain-length polyhydroxyalkanoate depolymerase n=1 Tax=Streptomyces sp. NPDC097107 TaxID=3366089 RepID=UPI003804F9F7
MSSSFRRHDRTRLGRQTDRIRLRTVLASTAAAICLMLATPSAALAADQGDIAGSAGRVDHRTYEAATGVNDYLVYVPKGWKPSDKLPLYVMVHGCGTTAEQQMHANLLNPLADRERFLVAYPDNGGQCWRAVTNDQASTTRGGGGDADIVAGITRQTSSAYNVNTDRVYLMGMSSGAFQSSATAAAYPHLYAAAGVSAGGGYGMDFLSCMVLPDATAPLYAPQAVAQMGPRAHVMPFFSIGGTSDPLGEQHGLGGCARHAYLEWLAVDNLLKPGADGDTFRDDPASTRTGQVPDGYAWTSELARGRDGCQIAERWIVDGMSHYWPGGTTDPEYAGTFNDPKAPSASDASWRFFKQFTLSGGNVACRT